MSGAAEVPGGGGLCPRSANDATKISPARRSGVGTSSDFRTVFLSYKSQQGSLGSRPDSRDLNTKFEKALRAARPVENLL